MIVLLEYSTCSVAMSPELLDMVAEMLSPVQGSPLTTTYIRTLLDDAVAVGGSVDKTKKV